MIGAKEPDDATSRLMHLKFVETESTFDYFQATREYLEAHGKPVAFNRARNAHCWTPPAQIRVRTRRSPARQRAKSHPENSINLG